MLGGTTKRILKMKKISFKKISQIVAVVAVSGTAVY